MSDIERRKEKFLARYSDFIMNRAQIAAFPLRKGRHLFYKGNINMKNLTDDLATMEARHVGEHRYEADVRMSVWYDSGEAEEKDDFVLLPANTHPDDDPGGDARYVFSPYKLRMWEVSAENFERHASETGTLGKAAWYTGTGKMEGLVEDEPPEGLVAEIDYNGFDRLEEPRTYPFHINGEVDTLEGHLDYTIRGRPRET